MTMYKTKVHGITPITVVATGGTQLGSTISFDQDVEIMGVFAEKPANGTLQINIEPHNEAGVEGPSIPLAHLVMAALDTSKHLSDIVSVCGGDIGRLTVVSVGSTGNKKVTVYARALSAAGR
ncbi:MAG: hypothetical protein KKB59_20180 [Spirochaetes bacterium]|nr:hypothetical protein [Spirochaetota bacterium]